MACLSVSVSHTQHTHRPCPHHHSAYRNTIIPVSANRDLAPSPWSGEHCRVLMYLYFVFFDFQMILTVYLSLSLSVFFNLTHTRTPALSVSLLLPIFFLIFPSLAPALEAVAYNKDCLVFSVSSRNPGHLQDVTASKEDSNTTARRGQIF